MIIDFDRIAGETVDVGDILASPHLVQEFTRRLVSFAGAIDRDDLTDAVVRAIPALHRIHRILDDAAPTCLELAIAAEARSPRLAIA